MEQKTLKAYARTELKKGATGRLRKTGKIPAVVYGHNDPAMFAIDAHEFDTKFKAISENVLINLKSDDKDIDVLVKDYQEDIMTGRIQHIDFFEIERGKVLRTNIPVHLEGSAIGVREGGLLEHLLHEIEVECLPKDIPEEFILNIDELAIGDSIHVSDLEVQEGIKIMNADDQTVVSVVQVRVTLEEPVEGEEIEGEEGEEAAEGEETEDAAAAAE